MALTYRGQERATMDGQNERERHTMREDAGPGHVEATRPTHRPRYSGNRLTGVGREVRGRVRYEGASATRARPLLTLVLLVGGESVDGGGALPDRARDLREAQHAVKHVAREQPLRATRAARQLRGRHEPWWQTREPDVKRRTYRTVEYRRERRRYPPRFFRRYKFRDYDRRKLVIFSFQAAFGFSTQTPVKYAVANGEELRTS